MNYRPTCAVCGRSVEPDSDHVRVDAEWKRMHDRDDVDEFYLHKRCALNTIDSWRAP